MLIKGKGLLKKRGGTLYFWGLPRAQNRTPPFLEFENRFLPHGMPENRGGTLYFWGKLKIENLGHTFLEFENRNWR